MGFTKKTWLALALALVLVLGLSVTALAATPVIVVQDTSSATVSSIALKTSKTAAEVSKTIKVIDSGNSNAAINNATVVSGDTTVATVSKGTGNTWIVTAKKAGSTNITFDYTGATQVTVPVTVTVGSIAISKTTMNLITSSYISGTTDTFTVTDPLNNSLITGVDFEFTTGTDNSVVDAKTNWAKTAGFEVTAKAVGTVKIKAKLGSLYSEEMTINVAPSRIKLVGATATPAAPEVAAFSTLNYDATTPQYFKLNVVDELAATVALADATVTATPATAVKVEKDSTGKIWTITALKATKDVVINAKIGNATFESVKFDVVDPKMVTDVAVKVQAGELPPTVAWAGVAPIPADGDGKDSFAVKFIDGSNLYAMQLTVAPNTATAFTDESKLSVTSSSTNMAVSQPKYAATDKYVTGDTRGTAGQTVAAGDVGKAKWPFQYNIEFKKAGTYSLTVKATDGSNYSRKITFKVENAKATGLKPITDMTIRKDQRLVIRAEATDTTAVRTSFTYKSSNKKAATIDSKGILRGIGIGKTSTITVKDSISGKSVTFKVTVQQDYSKITYRAMGLYTTDTATQFTNLIDPIMKNVSFNGTIVDHRTNSVGINLTSLATSELALTAINAALTTANTALPFKDEDVTAVYFNGKVDANGDILLGTAVAGTTQPVLKMDDLAKALVAYKGTFVMLMDCEMGSKMIAAKGLGNTTPASVTKSIVNSFAKQSALSAKTIRSATADGNFARFRMLVSTATATQKANSFSMTFNTETTARTEKIFTSILYTGLNPASIKYMPADYNKNSVITLNELYKYMASKVKAEAKKLGYSQSIAVWPRASDVSPVYARVSK